MVYLCALDAQGNSSAIQQPKLSYFNRGGHAGHRASAEVELLSSACQTLLCDTQHGM